MTIMSEILTGVKYFDKIVPANIPIDFPDQKSKFHGYYYIISKRDENSLLRIFTQDDTYT